MDIPANGHGGPVTPFTAMTEAEQDKARRALRTDMRARRRDFVDALPTSVRGIAFRALPSPVRSRIPAGSTIGLYAPTRYEAPTRHIANQLGEAGHRLCLPYFSAADSAMHFAAWLPDDPLEAGPHKVEQPVTGAPLLTPDILLIPLIAFDSRLNRMGQGGGHYDRALADLPHALRVGLAWSVQQVDLVPNEDWDIPMDIIVTEQRFFERQEH